LFSEQKKANHQLIPSEEEYKNLLEEAGILIDKRYFP